MENRNMVKKQNEVSYNLSPYDEHYSLQLLSENLNSIFTKAKSTANNIYKEVAKHSTVVTGIKDIAQKNYRYVVDTSDKMLSELERGKIKLAIENGKITAQIREANGHYGEKLGIKKEFMNNMDPSRVANALQMLALQEQIDEIQDQIQTIHQNVYSVLEGQQNDRIGLYYSGLTLYLESKNVIDNELKKQLIVQSLKLLTESSFQLALTMQSDISFLESKGYETAKGKREKIIDERMNRINKSFEFIHQATLLRAAIYCEQEEIGVMANVLSEYSKFIETTIATKAYILSQCDLHDNGTGSGVWKRRAKLKLDVETFSKALNSQEKVFYLKLVEEEK